MNYDITKNRISIDQVTMTSDDKRVIYYDPSIMKSYKRLPRIPISKNQKPQKYRFFYEYQHPITSNRFKVFAYTGGGPLFTESDSDIL